MDARNEVLMRARALRRSAATRAAALANSSSNNLSRLTFLGLFALILMQSTSVDRTQISISVPSRSIEIVRTHPAPLAPSPASDPAKPGAPEAATTGHQSEGATAPQPGKEEKSAHPVPPWAQPAQPWTESEIAAAKSECDRLLGKITLVSEALPPAREGICGAPAPRELKSLGESKVEFEPPATLNCPMVAALNSWISDKLQPAAKKSFGSPVRRIMAESYSCRNRYGLANAPVSEHAFMNAIDITGFVLANGKVIKISKGWAAPVPVPAPQTVDKSGTQPRDKSKIRVAIPARLGAHDVAEQSGAKANTAAANEATAAKEASSTFLHQAHDAACDVFGTVLGPDANDAHHDHFHLDMKARKEHSLCQ